MKAKEIIEEWVEWLEVDKSPRTAHDYKCIVEKYIRENKLSDIEAVTPKEISEWINQSGSMGYSRRKIVLCVVKCFYNYARCMGHTVKDPSRIVKIKMDSLTHKQKETKHVEAFTKEEVDQIVTYLDEQIKEIKHQKDHKVSRCNYRGEKWFIRMENLDRMESWNRFWRSAVRLSYETGLRLSDICQLEWDCIDGQGLNVWTDKRDKRVSIPLWPEVTDALNAIVYNETPRCFPEHAKLIKDPYKRYMFSQNFSRLIEKVGIARKGLSFHSLRHACLTKWRSRGMDLEHIQKLAGHSSTNTTEGYIHT